MSFHGHAAVTRDRGLGWNTGGMGRKMAAQRPGGAQAGIGTGTEVHTHVSTPVHLCAWASMQDHIPRDPALHPRSDAHRVWVEVTRGAGPPAADDSRVKPGMGVHCDSSGLRTTSEASSPPNSRWGTVVSRGCKAWRYRRAAVRGGGLGGSVPVTL